MRRFKLIVLLAVLFLGACQKFDACTPEESAGTDGKGAILWTQKQVEGVASRAVAETDKLWEAGDTIRIKFQNGSLALQDQVKQYAVEWLTYANLVFLYVDASEDADVKIGFDMDERWLAWSAIGKDCQSVPQDSVSLNFVWLEDEGAAGVKAEVLRGFGHVLGLGFEHKNPGSNVQFKSRETVAEEYNLSEADVEELITLYSTDRTNFTEYDKSSIMTIAIPRSLVTKPIYATSRNSELSELDKEFVAGLYPYGEIPIVTMVTGKQTVQFNIHKLQSIDVDWGDGVRETLEVSGYDGSEYIYSDTALQMYYNTVEHTYNDGEEHTIRFYGDRSALTYLMCPSNELVSLDVRRNKELVYFNCSDNLLTTLNVKKCTKLISFACEKCRLTTLDLSLNKRLTGIVCDSNQLVVLNLGEKPALKAMSCTGGQLSTLDLSGCTNLRALHCKNNLIYSLNLDDNVVLQTLFCENNRLVSLAVSHNLFLSTISCFDNPFISNSTALLNFANSLPDFTNGVPGESSPMAGSVIIYDPVGEDLIRDICETKNWKIYEKRN